MSEEKLPTEVINAKDANTKKPIPLEVIVKNDNVITTRRQSWEIHWEIYQQPHHDNLGLMTKRDEFEKQLVRMAADGWELVGVVGNEMFFKRLK